MRYEIWSEGYLITGCEGVPVPSQLMGIGYGDTFEQACINYYKKNPNINFNPETMSFWGCKLYPSKAQASKSFG